MNNQIVLTGNCYWCMEAVFKRARGILNVQAGHYSLEHYPKIAFSKKDKLEAIKIEYDSEIISLNELFGVYFFAHNPTLNSWIEKDCFFPGCRSAVFCFTDEQEQALKNKISEIKSFYETEIFTKIEKFKENSFVLLEEKHQDYYEKNPSDGYCTSIINPKIDKMKESLSYLYKDLKK